MAATLVVPTVPAANFTTINYIIDASVSTQKLAVASDGSITETVGAGTAFLGGVSNGGAQAPSAVAGGTTSDVVVKATAGRLCKVLVRTLGSAQCEIYDNASAGSGKIIGVIAASAAAGTFLDFQMPAANGITVKGASNQPAITVFYE